MQAVMNGLTPKYIQIQPSSLRNPDTPSQDVNRKKAQDTTLSDKSKEECTPTKQRQPDSTKLYIKLLECSKYRTNPFKTIRQKHWSPCEDQVKVKFNRGNLLSIFCQDIRSSEIDYEASAGEHINFQLFFNYLLEQLTYLEKMTARPEKLVKIKTTILRRVMDEYCDEFFPRKGDSTEPSRKLNKRLNKEDQIRFEQASLPIPPSRMQSEYINRLFDNRPFRQYYMQYIQTDKLRKYLTTISRRSIQFFRENMMMLLTKNYGLRAVIDAYQHAPNPPLFYRQIKIYLKQAQIIAKNLIRNIKLQQTKVSRQIKEAEEGSNQSFNLQLWEKKNYIEQLYPQVQKEISQKIEEKRNKKAFTRLKRQQ